MLPIPVTADGRTLIYSSCDFNPLEKASSVEEVSKAIDGLVSEMRARNHGLFMYELGCLEELTGCCTAGVNPTIVEALKRLYDANDTLPTRSADISREYRTRSLSSEK